MSISRTSLFAVVLTVSVGLTESFSMVRVKALQLSPSGRFSESSLVLMHAEDENSGGVTGYVGKKIYSAGKAVYNYVFDSDEEGEGSEADKELSDALDKASDAAEKKYNELIEDLDKSAEHYAQKVKERRKEAREEASKEFDKVFDSLSETWAETKDYTKDQIDSARVSAKKTYYSALDYLDGAEEWVEEKAASTWKSAKRLAKRAYYAVFSSSDSTKSDSKTDEGKES